MNFFLQYFFGQFMWIIVEKFNFQMKWNVLLVISRASKSSLWVCTPCMYFQVCKKVIKNFISHSEIFFRMVLHLPRLTYQNWITYIRAVRVTKFFYIILSSGTEKINDQKIIKNIILHFLNRIKYKQERIQNSNTVFES